MILYFVLKYIFFCCDTLLVLNIYHKASYRILDTHLTDDAILRAGVGLCQQEAHRLTEARSDCWVWILNETNQSR